MLLLAAPLLMSSSIRPQPNNFKPHEMAVHSAQLMTSGDGADWKAQIESGDVDQFTLFRSAGQYSDFAWGDNAMEDTVVLIPPGVSFLNLTKDTWYAMSRYRLEIAVINTRSLASCEKLLKEADKRDTRNIWGNRIRESIIIALAVAYVLK